MTNPSYIIHKGLDRPIEFKGLKGRYVIYMAVGLIGLLMAFVILYLLGLSTTGCLGIVSVTAAIFFYRIAALSRRYGQYDGMKNRAAKKIPGSIQSRSKHVFQIKESLENQ
jgi:hypothetical protein